MENPIDSIILKEMILEHNLVTSEEAVRELVSKDMLNFDDGGEIIDRLNENGSESQSSLESVDTSKFMVSQLSGLKKYLSMAKADGNAFYDEFLVALDRIDTIAGKIEEKFGKKLDTIAYDASFIPGMNKEELDKIRTSYRGVSVKKAILD